MLPSLIVTACNAIPDDNCNICRAHPPMTKIGVDSNGRKLPINHEDDSLDQQYDMTLYDLSCTQISIR